MAETVVDLTKLRSTMYDVSWGDTPATLGALDEVSPDLEYLLRAIKVGSLGEAVLGHRFQGLKEGAKIGVKLRQVTRAQIVLLTPWARTEAVTGNILLTPAVGADLYSEAEKLIIHPRDRGALTDEDLTIRKALPMKAIDLSRNGVADDVWSVEFWVYPDRTLFPELEYFYYPPVA